MNFQTRYTCSLTLALLDALKKFFTRMRHHTQFIQISINAMTDNPSFINQIWRVVIDFFFYLFGNNMTGIQLISYFLQSHIIRFGTSGFYGFNGFERHFELHHFARINASDSYFGYDAFQITN